MYSNSPYRRYTDVSNAEAQARESQIQLALERVRARTMAMQHSDELKDAAGIIISTGKIIRKFLLTVADTISGIKMNTAFYFHWMSTQDGSDFNAVSNIPLTEDANFIRYVEYPETKRRTIYCFRNCETKE